MLFYDSNSRSGLASFIARPARLRLQLESAPLLMFKQPLDIGHFEASLMLYDGLDNVLFCVSWLHVEISIL
ncbi:MAG: hypothetical protein CMQ37_10385 [Gammaproteobacteria bacterium]|nr:hypothetical protein [Gammaproteobacteria bacterium]